jgi:hypothetical protein
MTNFGILMEINGIEDPFTWSRNIVNQLQYTYKPHNPLGNDRTGLYYSPNSYSKTF